MRFSICASFLASAVVTVASAYTPFDSCIPDAHAFEQAAFLAKCVVTSKTNELVMHNCWRAGNIHAMVYINAPKNNMQILMGRDAKASFTLHGSCLDKGAQVAHIDIHIGKPAPYAHIFKAFNRICDLSKGMEMHFFSYKITNTQLAECVKHPVKPID